MTQRHFTCKSSNALPNHVFNDHRIVGQESKSTTWLCRKNAVTQITFVANLCERLGQSTLASKHSQIHSSMRWHRLLQRQRSNLARTTGRLQTCLNPLLLFSFPASSFRHLTSDMMANLSQRLCYFSNCRSF
jgi:hypothetical protein